MMFGSRRKKTKTVERITADGRVRRARSQFFRSKLKKEESSLQKCTLHGTDGEPLGRVTPEGLITEEGTNMEHERKWNLINKIELLIIILTAVIGIIRDVNRYKERK